MHVLKNNTWLDTAIKTMLIATNIAFIIYFVVLAIYARPHYDDLHFMWKLQEMSIFDYIKDMYFSRSGRFGAYFLNGVVFSIINMVGSSWFMPLLFIVLGISICCYVAVDIFPKVNKLWICNFVVLFYFIYILTNIDFAVINWLCAMGYYLKFPIALLLFSFINKAKLNIWQWIVLVVSAVSIGAGNEAFSPLILVFILINGLYYFYQYKNNFRNTFADNRVQKLCLCAAVIVVLMAIVVVAPGNYARMADTTQFNRPNSIIEWVGGLGQAGAIYHYFVLFYLPYYIVLMGFAYLLGGKSNINGWFDQLNINKKRILLSILVLYIIYISCTILPSVFLYGDFGVQRNYTHAVFMTMLVLCMVSFLVGYWRPCAMKSVKYLSLFGIIVLFSIMVLNCTIDFPLTKAYADSVDERIAYCNEMQQQEYLGLLEVEPLIEPQTIDIKYTVFSLLNKPTCKPMLYYISDTEDTPNEYAYHMKRLYGWDFDIVLRKE